MSGDDDDRHGAVELVQAPQQVDAADLRHPHVGDDAAGAARRPGGQEGSRAVVGLDLDPRAPQQEFERFPHRIVVVDHMHNGVRLRIADVLLAHPAQREAENRAAARVGVGPDLPAMAPR